jgi:hypothetical protein
VLNCLDRNRDLYSLCVWVGVDTLQESCRFAVTELGGETDAAHAVDKLGAYLRSYGGTMLVVLDNADAVRWAELAPLTESGHVVVTTRNRALPESASQKSKIMLSTLSESEALELLGVSGSTVGAVELVRALGCLPLALAHARSSITRHKKAPADLLAALQTGEASDGEGLTNAYSRETLAVLDLSVRNAAEACAEHGVAGDAVTRLAVTCGYLHAEAMPRWFLVAWLGSQYDLHGAAADMVLEELVQLSILSARDRPAAAAAAAGGAGVTDTVEYDMHRIMQVAMRARDRDCAELGVLLRCMTGAFEYNEEATTHPWAESIAAHAQCVSDHAVVRQERLDTDDRSLHTDLLYELGRWWQFRGLYDKVRASRYVCPSSDAPANARTYRRVSVPGLHALPCSASCWTPMMSRSA